MSGRVSVYKNAPPYLRGLTRYVANRRKRVYGEATFDEEDGWEREDGRPSSEDDSTVGGCTI
jgi:hypothetical protein